MKMRNGLMAFAAAALATAPALAAPVNPAASLSVSKSVRAVTPAGKKTQLAGSGLIIGIIAAVAIVAGIVIIADDDSDSN